jgi:hypothetical protein
MAYVVPLVVVVLAMGLIAILEAMKRAWLKQRQI